MENEALSDDTLVDIRFSVDELNDPMIEPYQGPPGHLDVGEVDDKAALLFVTALFFVLCGIATAMIVATADSSADSKELLKRIRQEQLE